MSVSEPNQGATASQSPVVEVPHLDKIVRPGTLETTGGGHVSLYCRIKIYQFGNQDPYLSFTGVIGPRPSGNAYGGCGQIDMEFAHRSEADNDTRYSEPIEPEAIRFADGWDRDLWLDLLDAWKAHHLERGEIDPEVVSFIESLPNTDRAPAWA